MLELALAFTLLFGAPITKEDVNCLALNIYHEARGEPVDGQLMVAFVTKRRVEFARHYGDSYCSVVYKDEQFKWTKFPKWRQVPKEQEAWNQSLLIASMVLAGVATYDPAPGCYYFFNPKISKRKAWARGLPFIKQIGRHRCYGRKTT